MREGRRPHVHVLAATSDYQKPEACAALRLLDPFSHPTIVDRFDVTFGPMVPAGPPSVFVMQRTGRVGDKPSDTEDLVRWFKATGARLLYDIDDNLLDPHPDPVTERLLANNRRVIRFLLREADHVTVSTQRLRDRVQTLNPNVSLLPNALDERRFPPSLPAPHFSSDGIRIGYFGTLTHHRDLMTVVAPIRAALSRLPGKATVALCGISPDARTLSLFDEFAIVETVSVNCDYNTFMDMMFHRIRWDIGLAPLATGKFEAAKSDIKFLEYAAFGIPGLYSAHPAYYTVKHGITGMVATPDGWADCLLTLANDPTLRAQIVLASREYLLSQRTVAASAQSLVQVLHQVQEPRKA